MKLLLPTCLLVGYLFCTVENLALERTFGQPPKFSRVAVESRPTDRRSGPRSFNRAAVESFPSLGLSQRVPLRDAVEGRPPLDVIPQELQIRDRPFVNPNLIPVAAGPNPFLFVPNAPPLNFFKFKLNNAEDDSELCSSSDTLRGTSDCFRYQMCLHGQWKDQKCPPTLHWNAKTSSCDWPSVAKCNGNVEESTDAPTARPTDPSTTDGNVWDLNEMLEATPIEASQAEMRLLDDEIATEEPRALAEPMMEPIDPTAEDAMTDSQVKPRSDEMWQL